MAREIKPEDIGQYYETINLLIDKYISTHKIKPSKLGTYLKPGSAKLESFIKNNGLSDVNGIKRIIRDVIDDRNHMEKDGILTFESFLNEDLFTTYEPTVEHEKILADYYNVGLGHVTLTDETHTYDIQDFGKKFKCIIYSKKELFKIYKNLENEAYENFSHIEITLKHNVSLKGSEVVSEEKFRETYKRKMGLNNVIKTVSSLKGQYKCEVKGYYIWVVK